MQRHKRARPIDNHRQREFVSTTPGKACKEVRRSPAGAACTYILSFNELGEEDLHEDGADVVIVSCSSAELELRIRRASFGAVTTSNASLLRVGEITLDMPTFRVEVGGEPRQLSWMELQLLRLLMENFGRVLTREHILGSVWTTDHFDGTRTVDVHVSRLRFKLGPKASEHFRTVEGRAGALLFGADSTLRD